MPHDEPFNVRTFGAVGDGASDDTAAIQKALDAAGESQGTVFVPAGRCVTGPLKVHPHTVLTAHPAWSYKQPGGAVLQLADADAPCLLDLTGSVGATLHGLSLTGPSPWQGQSAEPVSGRACGVLIEKPDQGREEDHLRIDACRISNFGGDGVRLGHIWCWTIRHSQVIFNGGHGVSIDGFDGYVLDSWISSNGGAGLFTGDCGACTTITGNRIEWNRAGGIVAFGAKHYQITGNFIDRSGGPGIRVGPGSRRTSEVFAITGNIIWRSGRPEWCRGGNESCQVLLEEALGVAMTGNALNVWRDDGPRGQFSPRAGIVCRGLKDAVIRGNTLYGGAMEKLIEDLGGHENTLIADNPGSLFVPPEG